MTSKVGMWVPPRWFRVCLVTPVVYVVAAVTTVLSPLLHLLLLVIDLADRKQWRFSRMGGIAIALAVTEFIGLTIAFVLWVASGFGLAIRTPRFQRAHNRLFGWWLEFVTRALRFYLGFEFVLPMTERVDGPILTFARHAGPGDAFLLARTVIRDYHRQLRMLGAHKLLWAPFLNHTMLRLPHYFLGETGRRKGDDLAAITKMCSTMGEDSVTIIFPEGGNWTPNRWQTAIDSLHERGRHESADRAATMKNVLPPRPTGALVALTARTDMTVVFVAHVGLGDLYSLGEIWRNIPLRRKVQATYWSVPAKEIPTDPDEMTEWLFGQWADIDRWISDNRERVFEQT